MKNGLVIALVVFVVLLFVVIGQRGRDDKVGVQELKLSPIDKDKITRIEVTFRPKAQAASGGAPEPTPPATRTHIVLDKAGDSWKVSSADAAAAGAAGTNAAQAYDVEESLAKAALDAVADLSVGDLIANKADKLAGYEIDDEQGQTVKVYTGDTLALNVVFGRPAQSGGNTLRQAGSNDVFVAKGRLAAATKKDLNAWRKKTLWNVKAEEIVWVQTSFPDGSSTVVESVAPPEVPPAAEGAEPAPTPKAEWKLTAPQTLPAGFRLDATQLGRVASALAGARAVDFAEGIGDDVTGLASSHVVVEARTKDGKSMQVHLGKEDSQKRTYARVGTEPQVYLLASYTVKQIARPLDDLRDLALVNARIEDIKQVTWNGQTKVVVTQDNGAWQLKEPKTAPDGFDASQIATQVSALLRLRGSRLATDAPASALSSSGPTVELVLSGGAKQTVRFGAAVPTAEDSGSNEPREFYARGGVDALTYVVPAFTRNRFDKPAELFRAPPAPPAGGGGGQIPGMENLPPDVRKKLQEAMAKGNFPP